MTSKIPEPPLLLWQQQAWPALRYDAAHVALALGKVRHAQGVSEGKLTALGIEQRQELAADAWTQEAVSTAAIEGEKLDIPTVRSSVARRLGVADAAALATPRHVDGLLDIMDDALENAGAPLTHERLHAWQAALFPTGYSGMTRIVAGEYRRHAEPMQIVSGGPGRERIHYQAPPSAAVREEMDRFLAWFNTRTDDALVAGALAHLWFETIHPFEDGNGRVGRVIVDLVLARDSGDASRLLRISQQLLASRKAYYAELEHAQHGDVDVTRWVLWFLEQVRRASEAASTVIDDSLAEAAFWSRHRERNWSPRQRKVVNKLLDVGPGNFVGGMSTGKYQTITGASAATASRDLAELVSWGVLVVSGAGRATRYDIDMNRPGDES